MHETADLCNADCICSAWGALTLHAASFTSECSKQCACRAGQTCLVSSVLQAEPCLADNNANAHICIGTAQSSWQRCLASLDFLNMRSAGARQHLQQSMLSWSQMPLLKSAREFEIAFGSLMPHPMALSIPDGIDHTLWLQIMLGVALIIWQAANNGFWCHGQEASRGLSQHGINIISCYWS